MPSGWAGTPPAPFPITLFMSIYILGGLFLFGKLTVGFGNVPSDPGPVSRPLKTDHLVGIVRVEN